MMKRSHYINNQVKQINIRVSNEYFEKHWSITDPTVIGQLLI